MQDVFVTSRMCGCNDPAWLVSFLAKCLDDADVARSLLQLRKNSPEKFQRTKDAPALPRPGIANVRVGVDTPFEAERVAR